jgi:AcrR family transcriptional regulator
MGRKGEAKRQEIVDAAKKMLLKNGPDGLVLREVADKLGITHGNLQYYYPTRAALLVAIFDQELAKYTDALKEGVASTSSRRGRLGAIIDSGLAMLRSRETALWRTLMSMADHNREMKAILKKENDLYEQLVAEELRTIAPRLSLQRRRHIAKIIHAIIDGIGIQYVYEDPSSPDMRALESEIKAAIFALVESD